MPKLGCDEVATHFQPTHVYMKDGMIVKRTVILLANTGSHNTGLRSWYDLTKRLSIVTADQQGPLQVPLSESTSVMIVDKSITASP